MSDDDIETPTLDDLTWSDISGGGIDTDKVRRGNVRIGDDWYEHIDGDRRVVFGPGTDPSDGTTHGWDICTYVRSSDEEEWEDIRQNWEPTKERMLHYVKGETR